MKRINLLSTILIALFVLYSGWLKYKIQKEETLAFSRGDRIESFSLPSVAGDDVSLQKTIENNKLVWVNFWATWCGPCRREMPIMAEAYNEYNDEGFTTLAVSM